MTADLRCANCNVTISKENDYTFPCGDWYCWHCHLNRNRHEGCEKCTEAAKSWFALQAKPVSPKAAEAPGGQDARELIIKIHEICDDYTAAPTLSKHTGLGVVTIVEDLCQKYLAAPAAPSERADELVFTPEQVECLNIYQSAGVMHPFTCVCGKANLFATVRGWICPLCDYTQNWAHDFMKTFKSRAGLSSQEGIK